VPTDWMTSDAIIALSALVEPWITMAVGAAVVVLAVHVLADPERPAPRPTLDAPIDRRIERLVLALILVAALAVRVVGWDDALTPVFWFPQASTLVVERMLETGSLWTTWQRHLHTTQVGWAHESVVLLPIVAALQSWLGPRFGVPVLAGGLVGTLSVALAWALGRRMRSQAFGLLFAAFVAFSPLQICWARLGAYYIGAIPHLLLVLLFGYTAGRRGSLVLAALAGLLSWASLYHYYVARVAIPLGVLAIVAGMGRFVSWPRRVLLVVVWAIAFAGVAYALLPSDVRRAFWPSYGGYAGNKGEQSLAEFVERNLAGFREEGRHVPERYFKQLRTSASSFEYAAGMQYGGLSLLPTSLLGALGLLVALRRLRREWLWLVVAVAGFALPLLSITTARRLLVFDLAWCAFAAHGLLTLADGLGRDWTRRARAVAAGAAVGLVGGWGVTTLFAASAALPAGLGQPIPFGEAGFADGLTCKRCLEAAKEWQRDIAGGAFVVLFDNDQIRENRTSPGGLPLYGKIGAVASRKPESFVEAYGLMAAWDGEPPTPGVMFDTSKTDFATFLVDRMERAAPARIVWHFERPTLWERWLARRLAAAGGTSESFPTALSTTPGVRVVTPWERRAGAFAVLRELAAGLQPEEESPCVTLTDRGSVAMVGPVFVLTASADSGVTSPPEWLGTSWRQVRFGPRRFDVPLVVGASVSANRVELVHEFGRRNMIDLRSGAQTAIPEQLPVNPGLNCVAHVDGHWWTLDPLRGRIGSSHPKASAVPPGTWVGLARGIGEELVLASADQAILLFDPKTGTVVRRFPARVSPTVRAMTDECSQLAVGDGWIATVNLRIAVASFYDRTGRALGTKRLDWSMRTGATFGAIAGAGHYLGAATAAGTVRTFEVAIDPTCGTASPPVASAN
jgi:hypothetical protein